MLPYPNVDPMIGAVISGKPEILHLLDTVYGTEDLYDMAEVLLVDGINRRRLEARAAKEIK